LGASAIEEIMINLLSDKLSGIRLNNKVFILFLFVVTFIISLGMISAKTTESVEVSFYTLGEYHLYIQNENGEPIEEAVLNVFEKNTNNLAFKFPVDNYSAENDLVSNKEGTIIAVHIPKGFEMGRGCYNLFWVHAICSPYEPDFYFKISADGYQSIQFPINTLFDNPAYDSQSNGNVTLPLPNFKNKWLEVPIYELTFTMKKE
jgi:hypothetical protein